MKEKQRIEIKLSDSHSLQFDHSFIFCGDLFVYLIK